VYVNGVRVAALKPGGDARYYLTDQVDSVKVVLDDEGNAITRFEYLPYGEEWITETEEGIEEEHNPKYNGQELDKETGYYYYNARYYDPAISRFTTADNVIDGELSTQGWNRYLYCHGNPVVYKDPTGHGLMDAIYDIAYAWADRGDNSGSSNNAASNIRNDTNNAAPQQRRASGGENRSASSLPGKEPDVAVVCVIEGNIVENGKVVGMHGRQYTRYRNKLGEMMEHTVENVQWKEKDLEERQKYPWENPAEPNTDDKQGYFKIFRRPDKYEKKSRYEIWTDHSEGGIRIHPKGRSEGCPLFDTDNPIGEKSYEELFDRVYNNREVLTGQVKAVIDKRTESERNGAQVPYQNNTKYYIME